MKQQLPKTSTVSTRDFVRDFTHIIRTTENKRYVVTRYGVPIGVYTPLPNRQLSTEEFVEKEKPQSESIIEKRVTFSDLLATRFHSGEQNVSEQIDQIVYGISRENE